MSNKDGLSDLWDDQEWLDYLEEKQPAFYAFQKLGEAIKELKDAIIADVTNDLKRLWQTLR